MMAEPKALSEVWRQEVLEPRGGEVWGSVPFQFVGAGAMPWQNLFQILHASLHFGAFLASLQHQAIFLEGQKGYSRLGLASIT